LGGRGDNGSSNVGGGGKKKYRYRLIIPDNSKKGSSSEHDIVLTPTLSVSNDEQAKEEAALLGLLYLFPKLPHERTLPEPYRSTFLAALKNNESGGGGANGGNNANGKPPSSKGDTSNSSTNSKSGATANTQLSANLPSFQRRNSNNRNNNNPSSSKSTSQQQPVLLTRAQINEAKSQHKREVQARIRKHEAIRNANKPVEVFMSARFKKRIECLLSGDVFEEDVDLDEGEEDDEDVVMFNDEDDNVLQSYVHQRLVHEGFNTRHVTKAYREVMKKKNGSSSNDGNDDQMMDKTYEEVLQYLCIHLKEHQLPIGRFDPQEGQLDVVGGKKKKKQPSDNGKDKEKSDIGGGGGYDANILQFAQYFGLTPREAFAIYSSDKAAFTSSTTESSEESTTYKRAFWKVIANAASLPEDRMCFTSTTAISDEDRQMNEEAAANECEALEAIFEEGEFSILREATSTTITIALPFGDDTKLSLEVHYISGLYPSLHPQVLITSGILDGKGNNKKYQFGGNLHLKVAQYMKDMNPGQEVIFELFGHVQSLLQEEEDSSTSSSSADNDVSDLLSCLKLDGDSRRSNGTSQSQSDTSDQTKKQQRQATAGQGQKKKHKSKPMRRPRERSTFWNTPPSMTPPAEAYPRLSPSLARARSNLPAAKAKGEFLSLLSDANKSGGRVMLVTGETVSRLPARVSYELSLTFCSHHVFIHLPILPAHQGCGKTTQIPQFILENAPKESKIIVAQPRRLAATGVASRVALERGEPAPGKASVGYVVRGDNKMCASTRLMFCTTGVLLRQLQSQNALENISHILVDEVHERHLDTDVLLAILKKTLPSLPNLTVVLMSGKSYIQQIISQLFIIIHSQYVLSHLPYCPATMDADRFAKYWGTNTPRMHIPGFTHPVQDFMLEDVLELTSYIPPKKKKKQFQRSSGGRGGGYQNRDPLADDEEDDPVEKNTSLTPMVCAVPLEERLKRLEGDDIDYDLLAVLIKTVLNTKDDDDDGSILVFLPGAGEIDKADRTIQQLLRGRQVSILPLHGGLQPDKQQQVFVPARNGCTKIILSTNVAETSITIPDLRLLLTHARRRRVRLILLTACHCYLNVLPLEIHLNKGGVVLVVSDQAHVTSSSRHLNTTSCPNMASRRYGDVL